MFLFSSKKSKKNNAHVNLRRKRNLNYTLKELKSLAKKVGVTTSGTKKEISARILKLRGHLSPQSSDGLTKLEKETLNSILR